MTTRATSTFTIDTWDMAPYEDQDGIQLAKTHVAKTFQGDIAGTSTAELLMAGTPEGSAAYVGLERITASVNGKSGTFVLHHSATSTRGENVGMWTIVPDSGTGELRGIHGEAQISNEPDGGHTFTLDYDLD